MSLNMSNTRINNKSTQSSLLTVNSTFKRISAQQSRNATNQSVQSESQQPKQRVQIPLIKPYIESYHSVNNNEQEEDDEEFASCFVLTSTLKERSSIRRISKQQQVQQVTNIENDIPCQLLPPNYSQYMNDSCYNTDNISYNLETDNVQLVGNKRIIKDCSLKSRPHSNVASLLRRKVQNKAVKKTVGRWSTEERKRFLQAVELFQDNWEMVEEFVNTRNSTQVCNYAMKEYGTLQFSSIEKAKLSQEEIQRSNSNSNLKHSLEIINNSHEINQSSSQKSLDVQIQEFISMIQQFETLYRIQSQMDADQEILSQIRNQSSMLKKLLSSLIQSNTTKKRIVKQESKAARSSMQDIRERLNQVISQDLFAKLEVTSQKQLNEKYAKLSDWIARPITVNCIEAEDEQSERIILGKPYSFFDDKLQQKLKSLDSSVFQQGQGQNNSLAATSTSLSQVSDDSQDCISEMGDIRIDSPCFYKMFKSRFSGEIHGQDQQCI